MSILRGLVSRTGEQYRALASLLTLAAASCGDTAPSVDVLRTEARDSAGVVIVENEAPDPTSRLPWEIGGEPTVSIGALEGEEAYQLFAVEAALKLADGRILVANAGTFEIRVFDRSGRYLRSWGGEGEGPGEFTGLGDVRVWPGDSVMAWDHFQRRITIFDGIGRLGRMITLELGDELGPAVAEQVSPDGFILAAGSLSWADQERVVSLVRRSRDYTLTDATGEPGQDFGRHLDEEFFVQGEYGAIMRHPFRRRVHTAFWGERIVISPSDRYEIRAYDRAGALDIIVRREHELVAVTQADLDRELERLFANSEPANREIYAEMAEDYPLVESFPAFLEVLVDATGHLWVREYVLPEVEESVWTIFDPDGRVLGLVETPPGLAVFQIGGDFLLGRATDELDVEYVQLWSLSRNATKE